MIKTMILYFTKLRSRCHFCETIGLDFLNNLLQWRSLARWRGCTAGKWEPRKWIETPSYHYLRTCSTGGNSVGTSASLWALSIGCANPCIILEYLDVLSGDLNTMTCVCSSRLSVFSFKSMRRFFKVRSLPRDYHLVYLFYSSIHQFGAQACSCPVFICSTIPYFPCGPKSSLQYARLTNSPICQHLRNYGLFWRLNKTRLNARWIVFHPILPSLDVFGTAWW